MPGQDVSQCVVEPLGGLDVPKDPVEQPPEPFGRLVHYQPHLDGLVGRASDG